MGNSSAYFRVLHPSRINLSIYTETCLNSFASKDLVYDIKCSFGHLDISGQNPNTHGPLNLSYTNADEEQLMIIYYLSRERQLSALLL